LPSVVSCSRATNPGRLGDAAHRHEPLDVISRETVQRDASARTRDVAEEGRSPAHLGLAIGDDQQHAAAPQLAGDVRE